MSYPRQLYGNTVTIPETSDDYGPTGTALLDELVDGADGALMKTVGGIVLQYGLSTTTVLAASATLTQTHPVHRVSGSGGPVTLSGTTSVNPASIDGQLLVIQGGHATNTVTIQDGSNVQLRGGNCTLGQFDTLTLRWNGNQADWIEESRSRRSSFQNQQGIELFELASNGLNKITLRAPAALAADLTFTLPTTIAAGNFLTTDGSGNLSWGSSAASFQGAYDGGDQITIGAGGSIGITSPLAQNSEIFFLTQQANQDALRILKTAAGSGSLINLDNDGTGPAIVGTQDGPASFLSLTQNGIIAGGLGALNLTMASGALSRAILITQQGDFNAMRIFKTGLGAGNGLTIEDDGTGSGIQVTKDGVGLAGEFISSVSNDVFKITHSVGGAGSALILSSAGSSHEFEIANSVQISRAMLRQPVEAVGFVGSIAYVAGAGLLSSTNGVADIRALVTAADPSALKGGLSFWTNKGDSLYNSAGLNSNAAFTLTANQGSSLQWDSAEVVETVLSGGARTYTALIPAGTCVYGATTRITGTMTGTLTSWSLGPAGALTRYVNANTVLTAGETTDLQDLAGSAEISPRYSYAATDVVLTPNGGTWTAGAIKITIHFFRLIAPSS